MELANRDRDVIRGIAHSRFKSILASKANNTLRNTIKGGVAGAVIEGGGGSLNVRIGNG